MKHFLYLVIALSLVYSFICISKLYEGRASSSSVHVVNPAVNVEKTANPSVANTSTKASVEKKVGRTEFSCKDDGAFGLNFQKLKARLESPNEQVATLASKSLVNLAKECKKKNQIQIVRLEILKLVRNKLKETDKFSQGRDISPLFMAFSKIESDGLESELSELVAKSSLTCKETKSFAELTSERPAKEYLETLSKIKQSLSNQRDQFCRDRKSIGSNGNFKELIASANLQFQRKGKDSATY